MEIEIGLDCLR